MKKTCRAAAKCSSNLAPCLRAAQQFNKSGESTDRIGAAIEETSTAHRNPPGCMKAAIDCWNSTPSALESPRTSSRRSRTRTTTHSRSVHARVFDHYSINVEEIAPRTYRLGSAGVFADSFPGLPAEGFTVTCDRDRALVREDVQFLTWDHPLVTGAIDLLLGSEKGNSSMIESEDGLPHGSCLCARMCRTAASAHRQIPASDSDSSCRGG